MNIQNTIMKENRGGKRKNSGAKPKGNVQY